MAMEEKGELVAQFVDKDDDDHQTAAVILNQQQQTDSSSPSCGEKRIVVKPLRVRNVNGQWRVIVQDIKGVNQRERFVQCIDESPSHCGIKTEMDNSQPSPHSPKSPNGRSRRCVQQQFRRRQLLAFDLCHPEMGVFVDVFPLPSACSACHFVIPSTLPAIAPACI